MTLLSGVEGGATDFRFLKTEMHKLALICVALILFFLSLSHRVHERGRKGDSAPDDDCGI